MSYTEKLSEQLAFLDYVCGTTAGTASNTTSGTGTGVDMSGYHRIMAVAYGEKSASTTSTTATGTTTASTSVSIALAITISASTNQGFTGTATTITSTSTTLTDASTSTVTGTGGVTAAATASIESALKLDASGEDIQSARVADDRYVRATITIGGGAADGATNAYGIVIGDTKRYKPAANPG